MPNYVYKCHTCEEVINIFHRFLERPPPCPSCGAEESLKRDYSVPFKSASVVPDCKQPVGQVVRDFIEQAKEEVREEKKVFLEEDFDV
jgi:putative FmdB family regulatory protein